METINSDNDRGQAFIIGAILISIILIGTAVSLNAFLFTESVTEPVTGESSIDTVSHIEDTEAHQRSTIDSINAQQYETRSDISSATDSSMNTFYTAETNQLYSQGINFNATSDIQYGILLEQPTRGYDSPSDTSNWDLISSSETLRDASFTFQTNSLPASRVGETTIVFDGSSGTYQYIPTYEGSSNTFILYENPGVVFSEACTIDTAESEIEIDFRENTINGENCPELGNVSMNTQYEVGIENGNENTEGSFAILYEGDRSSRGSTIGTNGSTANYAEKVLSITTDSTLLYREGEGNLTPSQTITREFYNSRGGYFD
jgi:hypothetical protein